MDSFNLSLNLCTPRLIVESSRLRAFATSRIVADFQSKTDKSDESRCRGYVVRVGCASKGEIDFVAESSTERRYIQVAYLLESRLTIERELGAFAALTDSYPKILLSLDSHQPKDFQGIKHQSLIDFLCGGTLGG